MSVKSHDSFLQQSLSQAQLNAQGLLTEFAVSEAFPIGIKIAFGDNFNQSILEQFYQQWFEANFDNFPEVEIRSASEINGANGAFSSDTKKIYLAEEFINRNAHNLEAISQVLLEEIGHYIDAEINLTDADGDEGAIFSSLVRGIELTSEELRLLKQEDDNATIILDGQEISIEQQVIGDDDGREIITNTTDYPWNMIGWISSEWSRTDQSGNSAGGTGALFLSPYHVLTAAHVVWDKAELEASGNGYASTVTINFGQTGQERFYGTARMTSMMTFNSYIEDSNWTWDSEENEWNANSSDYDLALLTLDRNIGDYIGHFGYDTDSYKGLNVNTAGYPSDLADSWTWEHGYHVPFEDTADVDLYKVFGPVTDVVGQTLRYELDTFGGQSGSPVWRYDSDSGNRYVVGVHVAGTSSYNVAAQLTSGKIDGIEDEINNSSAPVDKPDFVDYDEWFGTDFAYFNNNETNSSSQSYTSLAISTGDSFTLRSVVRNNGTAAYDGLYLIPPSIDVSFYASTNDIISSGDYYLGDVTLSSIDPFQWEDAILTADLPDIPTGNYYIGWEIDCDDVLDEFDENNNTGLLEDFLLNVRTTGYSSERAVNSENANAVSGNDSLTGANDSNSLKIGANYDYLESGQGGYFLIDGNRGDRTEIDRLTGEDISDRFLLGDNHGNLYSVAGDDDYALITDFDKGQDSVQLDLENYTLGTSPINEISGTAIYQANELIAILEGVDQSNLVFEDASFTTTLKA